MTKKQSAPLIVGSLEGRQFEVGDRVDVFCDHNDEGVRVRGWLEGVVVQAEEKRVAVQFREDVFLTDGWMVPDRVLWCNNNSHNLRRATKRRSRSRKK
jgi:hypothetical protein